MPRRLLLVLILFAPPAWAAWNAVEQNATGNVYADAASVARNGSTASMWWVLDYANYQRMVEVGYFSQKTRSEFDCAQRRVRNLELSLRAEHMGEGKAVYSDDSPQDWEAIDAGSTAEKLWQIACK
jgi:hypothetical protein